MTDSAQLGKLPSLDCCEKHPDSHAVTDLSLAAKDANVHVPPAAASVHAIAFRVVGWGSVPVTCEFVTVFPNLTSVDCSKCMA